MKRANLFSFVEGNLGKKKVICFLFFQLPAPATSIKIVIWKWPPRGLPMESLQTLDRCSQVFVFLWTKIREMHARARDWKNIWEDMHFPVFTNLQSVDDRVASRPRI